MLEGLLVVLVAGGAAGWWWLSRRRKQLLDGLSDANGNAAPAAPEVFTREALLNRPRSFDPGAWDDAGAGAEPRVEGDLPTRFDREYLVRRDQPTPPDQGADSNPAEPRFLDREFLERNSRRPAPDPDA